MSLREDLARRFGDIVDRYSGHEGLYPGHAEALADEAIRFAEWARRKCPNWSMHTLDHTWTPLTLPPEGWTP